jgi:glycosyltransferase involved in cell wall biosynthesis
VLGFVPQLETLVQDCAAVIVPMRCGGGIKIRVVTAWANGWPVVGTKLMMEGLPAINEVNCLVADEPSALVEAMHRLCEDVLLRQNLVMAGKEVYATEFAWEAIGRKIMTAHLECLRSTNSL